MLLLAIAVVLPTVCLLWFMNQAVKNVQLAARQKLINLYEGKLKDAVAEANEIWTARTDLVRQADQNPAKSFVEFALGYGDNKQPDGLVNNLVSIAADSNEGKPRAGILMTYDNAGKLLYPIADAQQAEPNLPEEFQEAWAFEFVEKDFKRAQEAYMLMADAAQDEYVWRTAKIGQARCEMGRGRTKLAGGMYYHDAAYDRTDANMSPASVSLAARARVTVASLEQQHNPRNTAELTRLLQTAAKYAADEPSASLFLPMDSGTRLFVLEKALELIEQSPLASEFERNDAVETARRLLAAEELAAEAAHRYPTTAALEKWTAGTVHRLDVSGDVYGLFCTGGERAFLLLRHGEDVRKDFETFAAHFPDSDVACCVHDERGTFVSGIAEPTEPAFLNLPIGGTLPGWQARLYFAGSDIFSKAASRQVAFYIWTGVLVIVLILAAGGFAAQVVGRQVRLNRLKNDFIATVTHELKTPLASMRVLVDTLLEGNYKGHQQATEYLGLISKENERLSRMIDNFLTFSRMERNKQAFEMLEVGPAVIARRAAEVMKTKFDQGQCRLDINIGENLPDVLADHDAMVTAIVNLLDNAYKYSYGDREITLRVFAEDSCVCFCVGDNGVGLSRRAAKRIFNRFYQVDRSLSRRAEGCGLGLSIVKFIVDAHKGSISVESKPGKGSTFTIKLRAIEQG